MVVAVGGIVTLNITSHNGEDVSDCTLCHGNLLNTERYAASASKDVEHLAANLPWLAWKEMRVSHEFRAVSRHQLHHLQASAVALSLKNLYGYHWQNAVGGHFF